jgi:hypothetical protein
MIPGMAKNKKPADPKKPNRTNSVGIQFFTSEAVAAALERFITSRPEDEQPKKRAVLEVALKEYLTKRGFWPPPSKE